MEQFYAYLKNCEQFTTAQSINVMFNNLPLYRIDRIIDSTMSHLKVCWRWQSKCAVFESFRYRNTAFTIDIYTDQERYLFQIFERHPGNYSTAELLTFLEEIDLYEEVGHRMQRIFRFPAEEETLFKYIFELLLKLKNLGKEADSAAC